MPAYARPRESPLEQRRLDRRPKNLAAVEVEVAVVVAAEGGAPYCLARTALGGREMCSTAATDSRSMEARSADAGLMPSRHGVSDKRSRHPRQKRTRGRFFFFFLVRGHPGGACAPAIEVVGRPAVPKPKGS